MKCFFRGLYYIFKRIIAYPIIMLFIVALIPILLISYIQEKGGAKETIFETFLEPIFNKLIYFFKQ